MSNRNRLAGLADDELLSGVSRLVAQCNEITAELLAHLAEVESRMLYAELGFPNLFSYCVEALGFSEGAAARRCSAARACARFPEALELVARGDLHLSGLHALANYLQPENSALLFAACRRKSRRKIDEIIAARFPKPDAVESVRRLPRRAATSAPDLPLHSPPVPVPVPVPVPDLPLSSPPRHLPPNREIQPTAADRYKVQFTADAQLRDLIERACALCPDGSPHGQLANVVTRALELFVAEQEKRRFAVGSRQRNSRAATTNDSTLARDMARGSTRAPARARAKEASAPPGGVRRRLRIKAVVRREVHARDEGRCAWVSKDGRRCEARARLQVDHHGKPWAEGGADDPSNLRLLCQAHNLLHARHCFGALHVAAKIAARRAEARRRRASRDGGARAQRAGEAREERPAASGCG